MTATNEQLKKALRDVISNVLEDVPRATMTRHLVEAINDACIILGDIAPLPEDERGVQAPWPDALWYDTSKELD